MQRIERLDYLRAIAIVAVILVHTFDGQNFLPNITTFSAIFLLHLSKVGVPLFIFISGYSLYKYRGSFDAKVFYRNRFIKIIIPYMIISMIYTVLQTHIQAEPLTIQFVISNILNFSQAHLWFIKLILVLYIIYPLLIAIYESINIYYILISYIGIFLVNYIYPLGLSEGSPLNALIYFFLGMYVRDKGWPDLKGKVPALILLTVALTAIVSLPDISTRLNVTIPNHGYILLAVDSLKNCTAILLCLHISGLINSSFLKFIGYYSFGIYLIHGVLLLVLDAYILQIVSMGSIAYYFFEFSFAAIMSLICIILLKNNGLGRYIITGNIKDNYPY